MSNRSSGWIWVKQSAFPASSQAVFACFRKEVFLPQVPGSFPVRLCADARYKLYLNGRLCMVGPCKTDLSKRCFDEFDAAPYLQDGKNVWAVQVLYYPPGHGNQSVFSTATPGFWLQSAVQDDATGRSLLETDESWQALTDTGRAIVSEDPFFAPLQIMEHTAASPALPGWMYPSGFPCPWPQAVEYAQEDLPPLLWSENLSPRPIPAMTLLPKSFAGIARCDATASPKEWATLLHTGASITIAPYTRCWVELDAGELTTAYLRLRLCAGAQARIELLQAECYVEEMPAVRTNYDTLPRKGNRTDTTGTLCGYTDVFLPSGAGDDVNAEEYDPFWFRTFRYLRVLVQTGAQAVTLLGLEMLETGYPLNIQSYCATSRPSLHNIWDISARSLRCCMHETYEDCPFYEQLQYTMDSRSQILYTYASSADDRLAKKCMEDFKNSTQPSGLLNASYPNKTRNIIPGFSIYYIGMLYDHMMYFGDALLLCEHLPTVHRILHYFEAHLTPEGIVGKIGDIDSPHPHWSFIDWSPRWLKTRGVPPATLAGPLTMESLLYILGLQYAADICLYLGQNETARQYLARATSVQAAVNANCRGADGAYLDGPHSGELSQHCQVFAVLTSTCDAAAGAALLTKTLNAPQQYAPCTVAMQWYLFRALERCGLYEQTVKLWKPWEVMLEQNLTTCAEDGERQRSDCHAWGALALYELPSVILGVRPASPGYASIAITPHRGGLQWAQGSAITPHGPVRVAWEMRNGQMHTRYIVPPGIQVVSQVNPFDAAGN